MLINFQEDLGNLIYGLSQILLKSSILNRKFYLIMNNYMLSLNLIRKPGQKHTKKETLVRDE